MDKSVIAVIVVLLVILLGMPLLARLGSSGGSQPAKADKKAGEEQAAAIPNEPPYWNSSNLGGTQWAGSLSGVDATLTLNPDGTALAVSSSPLVRTFVPSGQLQGHWSVQGNQFMLEAEVPNLGKKKISGTISGKQIIDGKGKPLPIHQVR